MNASEDLANAVENATGAASTAGDPAEAASLPPAALIRCTEFRALTTQAQFDDLKRQQRELEAGIAAFNPLRRMTLDEPTRVTLPIGRAVEAPDVVASAGGAPGQAVTVDVRIGRYMRRSSVAAPSRSCRSAMRSGILAPAPPRRGNGT